MTRVVPREHFLATNLYVCATTLQFLIGVPLLAAEKTAGDTVLIVEVGWYAI